MQDLQGVMEEKQDGVSEVLGNLQASPVANDSTPDRKACSSQKCKYHRDVSDSFNRVTSKYSNRYNVNYLHLDPEKEKIEYQK